MNAAGQQKPGGRRAGTRAACPKPSAPDRSRQAWVGIDVSNEAPRGVTRGSVPLIALALVLVVGMALGLAALRIDLLRTRYAVSAAMERENELIEEQRQLIVRRRQLRDPVALAVKARERGFRPPAHVVSLPDPTLGRVEEVVAPKPVITHTAVAAVSAGPAATPAQAAEAWE
ncbi:MAG: hypothetical protein U0900_08440 [Myxococcota bacterium]